MVEPVKTFDTKNYWERRLREYPGIKGVGDPGRSPRFLEQQYRARMCQVEKVLRHYGLVDLAGLSVLDIGSGTGIWLDFWHQHRAGRVVGLDFAQVSVDGLQARFPGDLIVQADVSVAPLALPHAMRFDVISAFDVLLHIVDPDAFRRTIGNLAYHCAPRGWLVISDAIVQGRGYVPARSYGGYNKVRSIDEYCEVLTTNGFVIDSIWPATVLLANPLEAPNYLAFLTLLAWWKATGLWGRSNILAGLMGPGAIKADYMACRLCSNSNAPTAKIIFARRSSGEIEEERVDGHI